MANGVNKVILIGSCGKDPETKYTGSGMAITNISLATNESWKDKSTGQKVEHTEWHNLTFFNKLAEIAGQYLHKGSQIYIEGKLQTDKWEKDGVTRYTTKVIVNDLQMLGGKKQEAQQMPANDIPQFDDDLPM